MALDVMDKLKLLAEGAKYDVSCSSSGSTRRNTDGVGNAAPHRDTAKQRFVVTVRDCHCKFIPEA